MNPDEQERTQRLVEYLLGELSELDRVALERELESSEELRAEKKQLEATIGLVQSTLGGGQDELSAESQAKVFAAASAPRPRPVPIWKAPVFRMAASVVAAVAIGTIGYRLVSEETTTGFRYDIFDGEVAQRDRASALPAEEPSPSLRALGYVDDAQAGEAGRTRELAAQLEGTGDTGPGDGDHSASRALEDRQSVQRLLREETNGADDRVDQGSAPESSMVASADAPGRTGGKRSKNEHAAGAASPASPGVPAQPSVQDALRRAQESHVNAPAKEKKQDGRAATEEQSFFLGHAQSAGGAGSGLAKTESVPTVTMAGGLTSGQAPDPAATPQALEALKSMGYVDGPTELSESESVQGRFGRRSIRPRRPQETEEGQPKGDIFFRLTEKLAADADSPDEFRRLYANAIDPDVAAETILGRCRRLPNEAPGAMFFRFWGDNPFERTRLDALSTFSVDVDTASYALARRYLAGGTIPPKAQVRTEEFVNFFDADVPAPLEDTFGVHLDLAPSRFGGDGEERWMMRVVVGGREVHELERDPVALTFVIDTSGSMSGGNRMELVKTSLRLLLDKLDANDSVAIVGFSTNARLIVPMTSAANRATLEAAIDSLSPSGSTNAEAGLMMGYAHSSDQLTPGASNRVIFLSDGVANVGQTDQDRINDKVVGFRERGIYLNTIGVGFGNHNDVFLEQLADKGDGLCDYVDTPLQARKALVDNFTGTFQTIARDVKIQVEFDPSSVARYRLLGYENRAVADKDFRNDAVDAGEVGAGHQVTALYELELGDLGNDETPLATVRVRWKRPHGEAEAGEAAREIAQTIRVEDVATRYDAAPVGYRRAVLVAQFAEFLRRSVHARGDSLDELIEEATLLERATDDADFREFVQLLRSSRSAILAGLPRQDPLLLAIDAFRENVILRAELEDLADASGRELLQQIEKRNADLEQKIRDILKQRNEVGDLQERLRELGYGR